MLCCRLPLRCGGALSRPSGTRAESVAVSLPALVSPHLPLRRCRLPPCCPRVPHRLLRQLLCPPCRPMWRDRHRFLPRLRPGPRTVRPSLWPLVVSLPSGGAPPLRVLRLVLPVAECCPAAFVPPRRLPPPRGAVSAPVRGVPLCPSCGAPPALLLPRCASAGRRSVAAPPRAFPRAARLILIQRVDRPPPPDGLGPAPAASCGRAPCRLLRLGVFAPCCVVSCLGMARLHVELYCLRGCRILSQSSSSSVRDVAPCIPR